MTLLAPTLEAFFTQRLMTQREASPHTVSGYRDTMRASLARTAGLDARDVNVKFTTSEGMGFVGRNEGMAAMAVATVERAD